MAIWNLRNATYLVAVLAVSLSACQSDDDDDDGGNKGGSLGGGFVGKLFGGGGGAQNGGGDNGGGDNGGGDNGGGDNGGGDNGGGGGGSVDCSALCDSWFDCTAQTCYGAASLDALLAQVPASDRAGADAQIAAGKQECVAGCNGGTAAEKQQAAGLSCAGFVQAVGGHDELCGDSSPDDLGGGDNGGGDNGGGGGGSGNCAAACAKLVSCGADVGDQSECASACESQGLQQIAACVTAASDCEAAGACLSGVSGGGSSGGSCDTEALCAGVQCGFECGGDESCAQGCTEQYCSQGECNGCTQEQVAACFGQ
jgi:hypothetical protein